MKKIFIIIITIFILVMGITTTLYKKHSIQTIRFGGKEYTYETFNTKASREQGLSFRNSIDDNHLVLFKFPENDYHGFWMKDMKFNIDIIWLDQNLTVVDYIDEAKPSSYPTIFYPKERARYVVEFKSGQRKKQNIDIGTILYYK